MFKNLELSLAFGLKIPFQERISIAKQCEYEGIDLDIIETERMQTEGSSGIIQDLLQQNQLKLGGWYLPLNLFENDDAYDWSLKKVANYAQIADHEGCRVAYTWIFPYSAKLPYGKNIEFHVKRLKPVARILNDHKCSLAIEFIGTETVRSKARYEFIHSIDGALHLIDQIGEENVGLLLDSWHWYTSHGTESQITSLNRNQVLYVHVNDAPLGPTPEQQLDPIRCLPGETGVINLESFLRCLKGIGYEGPITPEPFPLSPLMSLIMLFRFRSNGFSLVNNKIEQIITANFWRIASSLKSSLPKVLSPSMNFLRKWKSIPPLEAAQLSSKHLNKIWNSIKEQESSWEQLFLNAFSGSILPSDKRQYIPEVVIIGLGIQESNFKQLLKPLRKRKRFGKFYVGKYRNTPMAVICQDMGSLATEVTLRVLTRTKARIIIGVGFAGALQSNIEVGNVILPNIALRGEGTTKYYASEDVKALPSQGICDMIKNFLPSDTIFHCGPVFTTGALIREDEKFINGLNSEGILGIECETSALFLISKLFSIQSGAILVVTDNPLLKRLWLDPNAQKAIQKGLSQSVVAVYETAEKLVASNSCT